MTSPGQGRGHRRFVEGRRREEIEDSCVGYYALVVADGVACCIGEMHEQLTSDERAWEIQKAESRKPSVSSLFKRMRKASMSSTSRFNPSIISEQPRRPGELRKPPKLSGHIYPTSEVMQRQTRKKEPALKKQRISRNLDNIDEEVQPIRISLANPYKRERALPLPPPPPPPADVLSDPNSLINRPKSAYTRNRRVDDEEPVFWQHSNRSTKRFRQSEISNLSNLRPRSLAISKQQEELRKSNGSAFENFINRTFSSQPSLGLQHIQPNPIINICPPSTPSLPPTPIDGNQTSQIPAQMNIEFTTPRQVMERHSFSKSQDQPPTPREVMERHSFSKPQDQPATLGGIMDRKRPSKSQDEPLTSREVMNQSRLSNSQNMPSQKRFSRSSQEKRFSSFQDQPDPKRFSGSSQETPKSKRYSGFRPLQLSFYMPGNRLSLLPQFSDDDDVGTDIPPMPEVPRPSSALMKPKPSVIADRSSTFHAIPRKAVGSQTTSLAGGSARSSVQSSVTLNNTLYSRSSILQDGPRSDARLSTSTWRNTQDFEKPAEKPARPVSRIWADAVELLSAKRKSTLSVQVDTDLPPPPPQPDHNECSPISEEPSPVSPLSPLSPVSPPAETPVKHRSAAAITFHDYEYAPRTPIVPKHHTAVDYHDYDYPSPIRTPTTPAFSTTCTPTTPAFSTTRDSTMKVSPLFHRTSPPPPAQHSSSDPVSDDEEDDDQPDQNSKPRSSSGSSTLYHGSISSPDPDDLELPPAVKHTLSIAFPSPTMNHRLSDWLVRSAGGHQVQSWAPQKKGGEVYGGGPDSPTLGFSWRDFGWNGETGNEEDGRKKRPYTVAGEAKYVGGEEVDFDLERFPVPGSVGVAY